MLNGREGSPLQKFEQLLGQYRSGAISPEEKQQIRSKLRSLKDDPLGRGFIVEMFFSAHEPQLAQSLYGLIRDADLKDVTLVEDLIQRDSGRADTLTKGRIVDLIADLGTRKDVPYSAAIDLYLSQVALNEDTELRNAAAAQRIWYLSHYQPDNMAALEPYLLDSAQRVREEMYSLIESRIASQTLSGQADLASALNAVLHHLTVSAEEKARVATLLATLQIENASPLYRAGAVR